MNCSLFFDSAPSAESRRPASDGYSALGRGRGSRPSIRSATSGIQGMRGRLSEKEREREIRLETIRRKENLERKLDLRKRSEENDRNKILAQRRLRLKEGSRLIRKGRGDIPDELETLCNQSIYTRKSLNSRVTRKRPSKVAEILSQPSKSSNFKQGIENDAATETNTNKENIQSNIKKEKDSKSESASEITYQTQSASFYDTRNYIQQFRSQLEKNDFFQFNTYQININRAKPESRSYLEREEFRNMPVTDELNLIFDADKTSPNDTPSVTSIDTNKKPKPWDATNHLRDEFTEQQKTITELRRKQYAEEVNQRNLRKMNAAKYMLQKIESEEKDLEQQIRQLNDRLRTFHLVV